jgi:hypothetical protein
MKKTFNKEQILKSNPKINNSLILKVEKIEKELEAIGIDFKPKYSLQLPLGGGKIDPNVRNQLRAYCVK